MRPKIGILGCGKISAAYLKTLTTFGRPFVEVVACADLNPAAAQSRATEFGILRVITPEQLLADPDIDFVANLTFPEAHEALTRAALEAGKHVYCEKPLALSFHGAVALRDLARSRDLMLSCAPDTLLGGTHQRARHLLDQGAIGAPASAFAQLQFGVALEQHYMRAAAGPLLDLGPYYVGALVFLLGPVHRIAALGGRHPIADKAGAIFTPEAPSRVAAAIEFSSGITAHLSLTRFGFPYAPRLEIFGATGNLLCADPNMFCGPVLVNNADPAVEFPAYPYTESSRGAGLIDMALALREKCDCRLNSNFCLHSMEILLAILESLDTGRTVVLQTTCDRPAPMLPLPPC